MTWRWRRLAAAGLALALAAHGCAHGTATRPDPGRSAAWEARFRALAAALPACPADLPAISVEDALARPWIAGACVLVRARLRLLVEAPPCGADPRAPVAIGSPGGCTARWALWSTQPPPPPSARPDRRGIGVWNGHPGHDRSGCHGEAAAEPWFAALAPAELPYPIDDLDGAIARAARSELPVAALATVPFERELDEWPFPRDGIERSPDFDGNFGDGPLDLGSVRLELARLCRTDSAAPAGPPAAPAKRR